MKVLKVALMAVGILFIGVQFVRPARTNPPVTNPYPIGDPQVESILRTSCFDCHSNETKWPWYSEVAPMSWQVADHVMEGRGHMNFSDWNGEKAEERFGEICEEIEEGKMPIKGYVLLHRDAKLSRDDISTLCAWSGKRLAEIGGPQRAEQTHEEHED